MAGSGDPFEDDWKPEFHFKEYLGSQFQPSADRPHTTATLSQYRISRCELGKDNLRENLRRFHAGYTPRLMDQTTVPIPQVKTPSKQLPLSKDQKSTLHEGLNAKDNFVRHIRDLTITEGAAKLPVHIAEAVSTYEGLEINIGVTGQSGSGKSSLINTFRSLNPRDPCGAKTGTTETTMKLEPYPHPENQNIVLWDMPGVNTPNFPQETYVDRVKLADFDALIVCTSTRFADVDLWLTNKSVEKSIPFYLVRTKVDIDVANAMDDDEVGEDEALREIETLTRQQLRKSGLPSKIKLYLISSKLRYQAKFHFPALLHDILNNSPEKNKVSLIRAMVSCSSQIIMKKRDEMEGRIKSIAQKSANDPQNFEKIFREEVNRYTQWFGLSLKTLRKSAVDLKKLDGRLQEIQQKLESIKLEPIPDCKDGRNLGKWFLGIGYFFGKIHDKKVNKAREKDWLHRLQLEREHVSRMTSTMITNSIEISLLEILECCSELALGVLRSREMVSL